MTNPSIPPCPVCGKQLTPSTYNGIPCLVGTESCSGCGGYHSLIPEVSKHLFDGILGRAMRDLGIETVEQVRELVGIACDACDERTVRATNRAENLVPLLRRRAAKGEKKYGR